MYNLQTHTEKHVIDILYLTHKMMRSGILTILKGLFLVN